MNTHARTHARTHTHTHKTTTKTTTKKKKEKKKKKKRNSNHINNNTSSKSNASGYMPCTKRNLILENYRLDFFKFTEHHCYAVLLQAMASFLGEFTSVA